VKGTVGQVTLTPPSPRGPATAGLLIAFSGSVHATQRPTSASSVSALYAMRGSGHHPHRPPGDRPGFAEHCLSKLAVSEPKTQKSPLVCVTVTIKCTFLMLGLTASRRPHAGIKVPSITTVRVMIVKSLFQVWRFRGRSQWISAWYPCSTGLTTVITVAFERPDDGRMFAYTSPAAGAEFLERRSWKPSRPLDWRTQHFPVGRP